MDARERMIDHVLDYLSHAYEDTKGFLKRVEVPLKWFDPAEPFLIGSETSLMNDQERLIFGDTTFKDVNQRVDRCILTSVEAEDDSAVEGFCVCRLRTVQPRSARGKTTCYTRYLIEESIGHVKKSGKPGYLFGMRKPASFAFSSVRRHIGSNDGRHWGYVSQNDPENANRKFTSLDSHDSRRLTVLFGVEFTRQMEWTVQINFQERLGALFVTDPAGAMEIFRLRDIPEGKKRRAALRNWIESHWRKKHDDPGAKIGVRRHMRGATEFWWNGLACKITPSADDLREAEGLKKKPAEVYEANP